MTTLILPKSIYDMPKGRKHANYLHRQLLRVERGLAEALRDCTAKTGCFLRYAPWALDYAAALPFTSTAKIVNDQLVYEGIEEWQVTLAEFYAEEATRLVREREVILKAMNRIPGRIGEYFSVNHRRKPWFRGGSE